MFWYVLMVASWHRVCYVVYHYLKFPWKNTILYCQLLSYINPYYTMVVLVNINIISPSNMVLTTRVHPHPTDKKKTGAVSAAVKVELAWSWEEWINMVGVFLSLRSSKILDSSRSWNHGWCCTSLEVVLVSEHTWNRHEHLAIIWGFP